MQTATSRGERRERVHERVRKRMHGTAARPRLAVFRSKKHIYAQVINDDLGQTLAACSSVGKAFREGGKKGSTKAGAAVVGTMVARLGVEKGIKEVVFDRGGYLYHGRVKALAEASRKGGLSF